MTKRFWATDMKDRVGYHEFQQVADLPCPFCQRQDLWLEMIVEHIEHNSASRAQRFYCGRCHSYFERSPSHEVTPYEVSPQFREEFRQTQPYEPAAHPVKVHAQ